MFCYCGRRILPRLNFSKVCRLLRKEVFNDLAETICFGFFVRQKNNFVAVL